MVCVELRVLDASVGLAVFDGTSSVTGVSAGVFIQASTQCRTGDVGNGIEAATHHMIRSIYHWNQLLLTRVTRVINDGSTYVTGVQLMDLQRTLYHVLMAVTACMSDGRGTCHHWPVYSITHEFQV